MLQQYTQIQLVNSFGQIGPEGTIDVDTASQFAINYAVGDITDPFSRQGTKSYKFKLVGSKEINQLLNHYYDINIVDGIFNHNRKQKVVVIRNGVIILDNAYMQLLQINKTSINATYSDQEVNYDIEIGNDITSFFTDITNKYLTDIDMSDMNHTYTSGHVVSSFGRSSKVSAGGGYKYVLPWLPATDNQYNLEECRPAISIWEYWNRIHQAAGYQWSWQDSAGNPNYESDLKVRMDKLFIPYNGDTPTLLGATQYEVAAEKTTPYTLVGSIAGADGLYGITNTPVILDTEIVDILNDYNPTTGIYTSTLATGTSTTNVYFEITYNLKLNNTTGGIVYYSASGPATFGTLGYTARVGLNNLTQSTSFNVNIVDKLVQNNSMTDAVLVAGLTSISSGTIKTNILPIPNINIGDTFNIFVDVFPYHQGNREWRNAPSASVGSFEIVKPTLVVTSIKMILQPCTDIYGYGSICALNDFIPLKIKQSDFIKGIANMYNLIIDVDPINEKKIIYKLRDDYYDGGTEKNWTSKFCIEKESNISFISNSNAKKVILTYKADSDDANVSFTSATKEIYGQLEYTLKNDNIKGIETKEVLFSPTPIAETSFGTFNPIITGVAPKTNIRILYDAGPTSTGPNGLGTQTYSIVDTMTGNPPVPNIQTTLIGFYPMLTHFDNPLNPLFDINFGLCDQYWYKFNSQTNNNLYSMFWRRTINQIDTGKLFTAYFWLTEYDISILKLNDKIWVKDTWYNINTLQYDPNSYGPTKVVLMTIDDRLKLDPIRSTAVVISKGAPVLSSVLDAISQSRNVSLNNNYSDSSVLLLGKGITTTADIKNTIVVGDYKTPTQSNTIYSENISTTNIDITNISINGTTLSTLDLTGVLTAGNTTGPNNIIIDTNQNLNEVGGAQIDFYSGELTLSNDAGALADSYIDLYTGEIDLVTKSVLILSQASASNLVSRVTLDNSNIRLQVADVTVPGPTSCLQGLELLYSGVATTSQTLGLGLCATYINSNNSAFNANVSNSVIIGGSGITATANNTVYVPNLVLTGNISNAFGSLSFNYSGLYGGTGSDLVLSTGGLTGKSVGLHCASISGIQFCSLTLSSTDIKLSCTGNIDMYTSAPGVSPIHPGALILPRQSSTEEGQIIGINGMVIYNSTTNKFRGYENGAWINLV